MAMQSLALAKQQLRQWMQTGESFHVRAPADSILIQDLDLENHPWINYRKNLVASAKLETEVSKQLKTPEFNISVFGGVNSFSNFKLYPGVQLGVGLPLWSGHHNARTKGSEISALIQQNELDRQRKVLQSRRDQIMTELAIYQHALQQHEAIDRSHQEALISTTSSLFEKGEIDFFQYIQSLEHASDIKLRYLYNRYMRNQLSIELNYLLD
jgi:cobalt-zinc-cadmium resistance protein CzcA